MNGLSGSIRTDEVQYGSKKPEWSGAVSVSRYPLRKPLLPPHNHLLDES